MIRSKGFMQMFSVSGVGSGVGTHLDFHLDTHEIEKKTDHGKQSAAREESKHNSSKSSISTDRDGRTHIFESGSELCSGRSSQYNDNGSWMG